MKPAEAAKRVGMNEAELRSVNRIPPGMLIQSGSTLLVPRQAHVREDVAVRVADTGQLSLSPLPILTRQTVRAAKGETVASLAQRYKLSVASVAEWNRVAASASFKPGQQVTVYLPGRARVAATKLAASTQKPKGKGRSKGKPVVVAKH